MRVLFFVSTLWAGSVLTRARHALTACLEQNRSRVLLDCRKMKGDMPLFAQFYVAVYAKKTRDASMRTALVGREDQVLHGKFVDNVAMISGVDARVFTDVDRAIRWLRT